MSAVSDSTRPLPDEHAKTERKGPINWLLARFGEQMPKGLYARALIIIIAPIVVLEGVVAFVFMERHWQAVTSRLSEATARNVAALISVYEQNPSEDGQKKLIEMARDKLNLQVSVLEQGDLPPARPKPFFDLLDRELSRQISTHFLLTWLRIQKYSAVKY